MTQTEALRLALEYVELVPDDRYNAEHIDQDALITAIKAALEAKDESLVWNGGVPAMLPKQKEGETFIVSYEPKLEAKDEPAAWMNKYGACKTSLFRDVEAGAKEEYTIPLYTTPPQRKPLTVEQPKVRTGDCLLVGVCASEGHKIQPQRTWVGLTDEEIVLIVAECAASHQHTDIHFARAIEAKLKEKNT